MTQEELDTMISDEEKSLGVGSEEFMKRHTKIRDLIKQAERSDTMKENIACPTMVGLTEASRRTGISYDYLRKLCLQNKIVHIRAGVRYLINLEKLVDYLNRGEHNGAEGE